MRSVLVTGFEAFGGHEDNPSALVAAALDGRRIGGARIAGRTLPVDLARLDDALAAVLAETDPGAVLAFGLAGTEAVIRLERVALNVADFAIPDNAGALHRNRPLEPGGPAARFSRLPLEAILDAVLAAGIPARLSQSAGLYLCNAAMYRLLGRLSPELPCGFIHLPPLPGQIARRLRREDGRPAEHGAGLASMPLDLQIRAAEIAVATTLAGPGYAENLF
jgi:pyroglutamyl-peptidase